jgi:hypothetical protein
MLPNLHGEGTHATPDRYQQWATSVLHLLQLAFGKGSPHYENFHKLHSDSLQGWDYEVKRLKGVFLGAKSDYDGGYAISVETAISGEIFGDFIAMAKLALKEEHKDVAAVLASAALEDTLKRFALIKGLDVEGKALQDVVNGLKSKGLVSGAKKSLLDSMVKIRDYAMHANWDKFDAADVSGLTGYVEQFLLTEF